MNASHSPTINITDPFPTVESVGQRSSGPRSDGSGDSFDSVYDSEKTSLARKESNNNLNNNELADSEPKEEPSATNTETPPDVEVRPGEDKNLLQAEQNPNSDSPNDGRSGDEPTQEDALLAGIASLQPIADDRIGRGEHLPADGKNLPVIPASASKELPLPKTFGDAAALEVIERSEQGLELTRLGAQNSSNRNLYSYDSGDLLKQERNTRLSAISSDYFHMEDAMDLTPSRNSAEAMLEGLALLGSVSSREASTAPTQSAPNATTAFAITSIDSQPASAQALTSGSTENLDASLNVRGNPTDWSQAIGEKIRWMRNASVSTAELHLNPADLGSIEIKIVTEDQQARVSFLASSTVAQEMIEESLSKLKELLADHGIALDQSDISQKENRDEFAQEDRQPAATEPGVETSFEHEAAISTRPPVTSRIGQVDHYV